MVTPSPLLSVQPIPAPGHPSREKILPGVQLKPNLAQPESVSRHPTAGYLGVEADPRFSNVQVPVFLVPY